MSPDVQVDIIHTAEAAIEHLRSTADADANRYDLIVFDEHLENAGGKMLGSEVMIMQFNVSNNLMFMCVSRQLQCCDRRDYQASLSAAAVIVCRQM